MGRSERGMARRGGRVCITLVSLTVGDRAIGMGIGFGRDGHVSRERRDSLGFGAIRSRGNEMNWLSLCNYNDDSDDDDEKFE